MMGDMDSNGGGPRTVQEAEGNLERAIFKYGIVVGVCGTLVGLIVLLVIGLALNTLGVI